MKRLLRKFAIQIQRLSYAMLRRSAPAVEWEGIQVFDGTAIGKEAGEGAALVPALRLIAEVDPLRFARIQQRMPEIVLMSLSGAEYHPPLNACYIDKEYVLKAPRSRVASMLIHEAAHAYLHYRGCKWTEDLHERIERICIREQIRFCRRAKDPEFENRLLQLLDEIPPRYQRDDRRIAEELDFLPGVFRRAYDYFQRPEKPGSEPP